MGAGVVWLISTVVLWAICTAIYTAIEGLVPGYRTRVAVMVVARAVAAASPSRACTMTWPNVIIQEPIVLLAHG